MLPLLPPEPEQLPATIFVLEISPKMFNVPPAAWVKVAVVAAAPPRMIGALMAFVPLVLAALIALDAAVPVFVNVSEPAVRESV